MPLGVRPSDQVAGNPPAKTLPCCAVLGLSAGVGTITVSPEIPWRTRRPSYETKKNVLSFRSGPPKVPPNWFWLNCGLTVLKYPCALSTLLRKYSYTLPCHRLVPDLVTTLTTAPELRPYSASKVLLITRNSSMASGVGWMVGRLTN